MNKNLLTYNAKVASVEQSYFSPVAVLPVSGQSISSIYCFLARIDPWTSDSNPEQPLQTQTYLKSVFKNIFALKQITSNNISPVIPRVDWTANTVYNYYQDNIDMFQTNSANILTQNFYIRNSYDQVFKCLWNGTNATYPNGAPSTVMPLFQPGTYGSNGIFQGADNYKWKYIYTIDTGSKRNFMDSDWIPVPIGENTPGPTFNKSSSPQMVNGVVVNQTGAWAGDIEVINVTNPGSGYVTTSAVQVNITGDGTGAAAYAQIASDGTITDIVVTKPGSNYSYANITITQGTNSSATAIAPISPIGGHGFDPVSEFGCNHVMFTCEFNGTESGNVPIGEVGQPFAYRQIGLLINPTDMSNYPAVAIKPSYKAYTQMYVAPGLGGYTIDEVVYQGSPSNPIFSATVLDFNVTTNILSLINITGKPTINATLQGKMSAATRTVLSLFGPDILLPSGYLSYIENRSAVQRSSDGIEQIKIVLGY